MNHIIQKIKNFEFLRFDKEIYINELKRQILDDLKEKKNFIIIEFRKKYQK